MKIKKKTNNKGQVHPFSTSSSSTTTTKASDFLSVLQLLPAAIVTLTSFLSLDDREVLAYMITLSLKSSITTTTNNHLAKKKSPMFECDCFQCYTSYWFRWDSSPNRELIHQAIEAFEEHLATGEQQQQQQQQQQQSKKNKNCNKSRKRDKKKGAAVVFMHDTTLSGVVSECEVVESTVGLSEKNEVAAEELAVGGSSHKGLARKVLPDVLGIFSSRLWSLWGPNV